MAKRKSLNRVSRRYTKRRSVDSIGSGHLDPDTSIVDEEQTLWWNNLEENTFPPHSMIHSANETPRMLRSNSRIDSSQSSDPTGWWKNLNSNSEPIASKSSRRSAAIVKSRMLQISTSETSESEKELNLRKKKVRLKTSNRKSINNAFANALNDPEATMPLKTRTKQVRSEVHIDSDSESLQGRSQKNEEDSNSSPTSKISKLKPNIFRTRRGGDSMKDQNAFQDVLTEDNVLNASTAKTSVAFEKESSQRSMYQNINTSKDHIDDQRKSIRSPQTMTSILRTRKSGGMKDQTALQDVPLEDDVLNGSTAEKSVSSEKETSQRSMHRNINTSKDHIDDQRKSIRSPQTMTSILRTRKSGGMKDQTALQDVPLEDDVLNGSTAEKSVSFEKETSQRSMHRNINTSKDHIDDQRKSIRALEDIETGSLTPNVKKAVPENNVEIESSDESIIIPRQHLKLMSHFKQRARKSIGKNMFADVLAYDSNASSSTSNPNKENNIHRSSIRKSPRLSLNKSKKQQSDVSVQDKDNIESNLSSSSFDNDESRGTKKSIFFKPKSRILTRFRKRSTNPFEEILKQGHISDRRSNVSFEDNRASSERETTRINQERESLATQKNPQSRKRSTTNEEGSYEIFLEVSSNAEKSRSKEANILSEDENKLLENGDLNNASKSVSRKSVIAKSSEEKISNLKSIREKTLKEIACANAISPIGRLSTNVIIQDANNDSHADIDVEHVHSSESRSDKEVGFISSNKQSSSKKLNKIDDFFVKIKKTSAKQLSERAQKSPGFDSEKMKKIKMELEKLKSREMAAMKRNSTDKKASAVKKETVKFFMPKQDTKKKKLLMNSTKVVDKAFLVNGKVYRPPRLPRPKHWATDRLYKFLWKRLEPKYKLATRVKSEKFVQELATVVTTIERRKNYENYKNELTTLMKEMARLKLINTRMDFYHFCQDFLPYEFRIKVIPMTLPGNISNIPFDPENVHTPLLDAE
ncbi:PREDICTED: uncharacterized protein LOC108764937 [Trachymyrmex cornetzi]|uniref:Uncharacterized protein n=1 Tax=Trachymyrmex cornetzi TaxID=471704 RepID=A0A151J131_9HYME|nr:PREDICTED: uncharacterized protein LOC108764937 [Trachymyrmex cornetzi]KYN15477.1 hypothetical protein ALC57_12262 [Trachymyrmex cornetzi]